MKVTVYGSGCITCKGLGSALNEAAHELGIEDLEIEQVCDINRMIEEGVWTPPAMGIDGEVVFTGRIPDVEEIKEILKNRK